MAHSGQFIQGTFVILLLIPGIIAWGDEGHYATCKIAEGLFSEETAVSVRSLLPDYASGDLASLCLWPDEIKKHKDMRWSAALHFADTPDFACNYEYDRDCHDTFGIKDNCVTGAIYNYSMQLMDYQQHPGSRYNLTEALLFLSHFFGDVHQPLHEGYLSDLGGNRLRVRWYETDTNLHKVWDDLIIQLAMKEFYNSDLAIMIQAIERNITDDWSSNISSWKNCDGNHTVCPDPYASESVELACKYAYPNATAASTLNDDYFLSRLPVVKSRLAQGGVRLAASLNRIFGHQKLTAQA